MSSSFAPMFDARHRTDFSYEPFSVHGQDYGGGTHGHEYSNSSYRNHSAHAAPYSKSSPIILEDGAIEWKQTPEAHVFRTRLPVGVRREDVKVQVEDDQVLKISGEVDDRHSSWNHNEISRGKFLTAMKLPEDVRADLIRSYWESGVLTVTIPRREVLNRHHHVRNVDIIHKY